MIEHGKKRGATILSKGQCLGHLIDGEKLGVPEYEGGGILG